ncbi:prepilin-type N-terminal cleavage/methylation domain-containing protein [Candidatus Pacebacteria bacterium]|nr:prepilin-type N-terminal cleavage/methylation domain-containing protein [Candidatus Paceibacterota bacterium]
MVRLGKKYATGFTLIELLIVLGIIGVIVSIILPKANGARLKGQIAHTQIELGGIRSAMLSLYEDTGIYPNGVSDNCRTSPPGSNEVDLSDTDAGLTGNTSGWTNWNGPYVVTATDSWGTPYYFDEDYQCLASTTGCGGITDAGNDSSVIVSCGPNADVGSDSCTYDADNIVIKLCN